MYKAKSSRGSCNIIELFSCKLMMLGRVEHQIISIESWWIPWGYDSGAFGKASSWEIGMEYLWIGKTLVKLNTFIEEIMYIHIYIYITINIVRWTSCSGMCFILWILIWEMIEVIWIVKRWFQIQRFINTSEWDPSVRLPRIMMTSFLPRHMAMLWRFRSLKTIKFETPIRLLLRPFGLIRS